VNRPKLISIALWAAIVSGIAWQKTAFAQQYLWGASATASSGVEGGSQGSLLRTRTRLRLGGDVRIDEAPDNIVAFGLLAEVEPRAGLGADARFVRTVGERFIVDAGVLGILAPASLYGACAGLTYRLPIARRAQAVLGPEMDVYFLGTDLPDGTVFWELRFQGGFRVDL